ncbi:succinate receptor 1-like [Pristis pectinata]|uniref:succinate receptor 1-like n=1 Tax=Pristis pectinata TaxID=685728 RepID=UPI00223D8B9F|nr:succinate receptor 1-like [Pristis pectinata]XP_051874314.1 succinate receptor 1-like [Pristis pectinata]
MAMYNSCLDINPQLEKYYLPTVYGIQFILGLLANLTVIWAYLFCLKEWKCCNIYLFNLSISDLIFTCSLPLLISYYSSGNQWGYSVLTCQINKYILHFNMYGSILFLTCISWDRYHLVRHPLKVHCMQKKVNAVFICLSIWVFVTLELLPIYTFFDDDSYNNTGNGDFECSDYASSGKALANLFYSLYLTVAGFFIPLCIMLFTYIRTVGSLKKMKRETSKIQINKPLRMVILAIGIFIVLFTPYHIMRNVRIVSRLEGVRMSVCGKLAVKAIYTITRPLAFLNSVINPVFYFMMGDKFREQIVNKLQKIFLRKPGASNKKEEGLSKSIGFNKGSVELTV